MNERTTVFPIRQLRSSDFPELLREIPDAPPLLYLRGTLPPKEYVMLCVVGSRATTPYGRRMCASIIAGLARYPIAIVSGLAIGIDAEAHKAALDVGLPTVAVLPSSCDDKTIYPVMNRPLTRRILARGGALIAENAAPHSAMIHDFPARNRIMAGMSKVTLVIEAGEKSGTLITAKLALDYNREVLALPHELMRESGAGVNRLIREGATLVRHSSDVLEALGFTTSETSQMTLPTDLSSIEERVLIALSEPLLRDEIIARASLSAQEANIAVSSLLVRGPLTERLGKIERV